MRLPLLLVLLLGSASLAASEAYAQALSALEGDDFLAAHRISRQLQTSRDPVERWEGAAVFAQALARKGQISEALVLLTTAWGAQPGTPGFPVQLTLVQAELLVQAGRHDEAIALCDPIAAAGGLDGVRAALVVADARLGQHRHAEARRALAFARIHLRHEEPGVPDEALRREIAQREGRLDDAEVVAGHGYGFYPLVQALPSARAGRAAGGRAAGGVR